ncbi:hypothetical protein KGF56_000975 [Candida oxycetoniae]|uniref:Metal homeostatis protein BSD2 n=1 Tax=Candida oxycetoniae TaxID=497107 RepID=A0AAI9SZK4_9ASCO|nr:uncharacterized protein KGF56_000975 [Candida oxycetoniae]KAI3406133.1 hypothetical protein KGF56_000975 [Candida oxycetoniae]
MTAYERLNNKEETSEESGENSSEQPLLHITNDTIINSANAPVDSNDTASNFLSDFPVLPSSSSSTLPTYNTPQSAIGDLESQTPARLTAKQRVLRVLNHLVPIKQTYHRLNNGIHTGRMQQNVPGRFIGQGTDGVFQNLMAKPDTQAVLQQRERELHPPTYEEANQDASPEYWESTMISPMYEDEVFVQGLPVGNIANFIWNALVTIAFQFVGFVLCYLLHTSHGAKQGARFGFGVNLIFFGWNIIPLNVGHPNEKPKKIIVDNPNQFDVNKNVKITGKLDTYNAGSNVFVQNSSGNDDNVDRYGSAPYIAYGVIAFGLFIIIKSVVDYYRVKQLEKAILNPPNNPHSNIVQSISGQVDNNDNNNNNNNNNNNDNDSDSESDNSAILESR